MENPTSPVVTTTDAITLEQIKIVELIQGSRSGGESKEKVQKAIEKALIAGEVAKPAESSAPSEMTAEKAPDPK